MTATPGAVHLRRGARFSRLRSYGAAEWLVLAVLAIWVLAPVAALIGRVIVHGGIWTGATGIDPIDEFQYLAWTRDMGTHILSSNLFGMTGGSHVFLQPMWLISGLLWRLGIGLQLSYAIWIPVSVVVLWFGFSRFARRHGASPERRIAILVLGLFFATPIGWLNLPVTHWVAEMQLGMSDATVALQPWFAVHTAMTLGLMPLVLLGYERVLQTAPTPLRLSRLTLVTALGAALVSWLHSWQGESLLVIIVVAPLFSKARASALLSAIPVAVGCGLPLFYQFMLTRTDAAWKVIEQTNNRPDLIVFTPQLAVLGPLVTVALFGLARRPTRSVGELMLVIWPIAAVAVYVGNHEFPPHALQGICLPLAVLAVRGWPRGRIATTAGVAGIALFTIPGLAYFAKSFPPTVRGNRTLFFQTPSEHTALAYLAHAPGNGGVLAPYPFSLEVPAYTDKPVWDGHQAWTLDAATRYAQAATFFSGTMTPRAAQQFVTSTGVRWVLVDCPVSNIVRSLGQLVSSVHVSGCADVVAVRG